MKTIPFYRFSKHKYGKELLIDVVSMDWMRDGIARTPVYRTSFYTVILITGNCDWLEVNGVRAWVGRGSVITVRPGEVMAWNKETPLSGHFLFFLEDFMNSFFKDSLFISKLGFLSAERPSPFFSADDKLFKSLMVQYEAIQEEIVNEEAQDPHMLRALLYETMIIMKRGLSDALPHIPNHADTTVLRYVSEFEKLVAEKFIECHDVDYYADQLCITPNYLNKIVRRHHGVNTKRYISLRIMAEAKQLLSFTSMSVGEIANTLHFETTTYFIRSFHRITGQTPNQYRQNIQEAGNREN